MNKDIAYLAGVLQSDGYIYKFYNKAENRLVTRLRLDVAKQSLPMSEKFQKTLREEFSINVNIRKVPNKNAYSIQTSINKKREIFLELKKEELDNEISHKIELFGAYLAGLMDGDGHIQIKNNKDRQIPQCIIRIAEDRPMITLKSLLQKFFQCEAHFSKHNDSNCVETCFYISKKNIKLFYQYVYPNIVIKHKIDRLDLFRKISEHRRI